MTASPRDQLAARDRLRRALLAFEAAQIRVLTLQRQQKASSQVELETVQDCAAELVAAFQEGSATGLMIDPTDQRLLAQARKYLMNGTA